MQIQQSINKKGFTLIELMVAISIVAILSTIGLTLFSNAQEIGRDGKRRADIAAIAANLESRWNTPAPNGCAGGLYCQPVGGWFAGGSVPYDPLCTSPTDCPSGATAYSGLPADGAVSYILCAKLEQAGSGNAYGADGHTTQVGSESKDYYCRKNQQQ